VRGQEKEIKVLGTIHNSLNTLAEATIKTISDLLDYGIKKIANLKNYG